MMLAGHKTDYSGIDRKKEPLPHEQVHKSEHPPLHQHTERGKQYKGSEKTV
jgi:hypothetical protein